MRFIIKMRWVRKTTYILIKCKEMITQRDGRELQKMKGKLHYLAKVRKIMTLLLSIRSLLFLSLIRRVQFLRELDVQLLQNMEVAMGSQVKENMKTWHLLKDSSSLMPLILLPHPFHSINKGRWSLAYIITYQAQIFSFKIKTRSWDLLSQKCLELEVFFALPWFQLPLIQAVKIQTLINLCSII